MGRRWLRRRSHEPYFILAGTTGATLGISCPLAIGSSYRAKTTKGEAMIMSYVEDCMAAVARSTSLRRVSEGLFWDWLGNVKFREDEGTLTMERATQIRATLDELLDEYLGEAG